MKCALWIFLTVFFIMNFFIIVIYKDILDDCKFECDHLQTRLTRCQELSDCAEALEQTLPSLAWAQIRALNEEIKQKRHWKYEGREMPLITK